MNLGFNAKIDYDGTEDSLYIYKENEDVKCSLDFEFGVIDLNFNDNVVGIEILEATNFLDEVSKESLKKAKYGRVRTVKKRNAMGAKFVIKLPDKEIKESMLVPKRIKP